MDALGDRGGRAGVDGVGQPAAVHAGGQQDAVALGRALANLAQARERVVRLVHLVHEHHVGRRLGQGVGDGQAHVEEAEHPDSGRLAQRVADRLDHARVVGHDHDALHDGHPSAARITASCLWCLSIIRPPWSLCVEFS